MGNYEESRFTIYTFLNKTPGPYLSAIEKLRLAIITSVENTSFASWIPINAINIPTRELSNIILQIGKFSPKMLSISYSSAGR